MNEKKYPMAFTIRFNPMLDKHVRAAYLLNSVGRNKAHIIAEAIDFYLRKGKIRVDDMSFINFEEKVLASTIPEPASTPDHKKNLLLESNSSGDDKTALTNENNSHRLDINTESTENPIHNTDAKNADILFEPETAEDALEGSNPNEPFPVPDMEDNAIGKILASMSMFNQNEDEDEDEE